jgi:hypothetical protein
VGSCFASSSGFSLFPKRSSISFPNPLHLFRFHYIPHWPSFSCISRNCGIGLHQLARIHCKRTVHEVSVIFGPI